MSKPKSPKRSYRLSAEGLASLRESARRNQPWQYSTGPRTAKGKRVSSRNALRLGFYTAEQITEDREFARVQALAGKCARLKAQALSAPEGSDLFWDKLEEMWALVDAHKQSEEAEETASESDS